MNKFLILLSLLLSMLAGPSLAAGTGCIDNWERDHSVNFQECVTAQTSAKASVQTELTRLADTNNSPSPTASQSVLCSQCHQISVQMGQLSSTTPPKI